MEDVWERLGGLPREVPSTEGRQVAGVLVPLYEERGQIHVVLTKRPDHMPTHAGDLAFPGGMAAEGDAGPLETALREAWEEVGIPPDRVEVLGLLAPVTTATETLLVVPVVGRIPSRLELRPDPGEVDRILRPPLSVFFDQDRWWSEDWHGRLLWFFEVDGEVLWGATARMVRQLLEILAPG